MRNRQFRNRIILILIFITLDSFALGLIAGFTASNLMNDVDDTVYINKDCISGYSVSDDGITLYMYNNHLKYEINCDKYKGY